MPKTTDSKNKYTLDGKLKARYMPGNGAVHYWVAKNYGKANRCENDSTHAGKRYEWANISREYRREQSDWKQLCPSCHRKMDYTDEQRKFNADKARNYTSHNEKAVGSIDELGNLKYFNSLTEAARQTQAHLAGISSVLAGRSKTSGGMVWFHAGGRN